MTRPSVPPGRFAERLAGARRRAGDAGVSGLLIGLGADLRYLTGYAAPPRERLTMLVIPAEGPIRLVVPRLESLPAVGCPAASAGLVEIVPWEETEDPIEIVAASMRPSLEPPADRTVRPAATPRVAVGDRLWSTFLLALQDALPGVRFGLASAVIRSLRMRKDDDEVAMLRAAAQAADRVIESIASGRLVGRTQADVANEVRERLVVEGHDSADFAIVASGPDAASPNHEPSDRVIAAGEPVVLDIGGPLGGYGSDITRTIWVTGGDPRRGPDEEFRRIYDLVREAQATATAAVRPGVPCERIDAVARGIIDAGGYGDRFIHRVGHGIGLEGHEDPYLVAGNTEPLESGMAFSIEPGIYLEGRYGVRIEDIVVCGPRGPLVLNQAPHELLVVAG
jgi:Xaa-Pro aminopeptidase